MIIIKVQLIMTNKNLGQYFTTNIDLKNTILSFIKNKPDIILEPCIGKGNLVDYIKEKMENIKFDMYEIDKELELLECINKNDVEWCNFLETDISKTYKTIIGNPPYIKTKKGNIYIDFIVKCFELLEENGELIFIVPSDFFKLTSASIILNRMMEVGTFTDIYHPHSERLFKEARIDVLVFRYCKNKLLDKNCLYNNKTLNILNKNGLITFHKEEINTTNKITMEQIFDIHVGIVSGRESIYKNKDIGNQKILIKENQFDNYILIHKFPSENEKINDYLLKHKQELMNRKIRKFNEKNWFEWGALRNISHMETHNQEDCIYISGLTRNSKIAFKGKVCYFSGQLMMLKPKIKINLDIIVDYLNSSEFKQNFVFCGRFKIGHRQLSNSLLPKNLIKVIK